MDDVVTPPAATESQATRLIELSRPNAADLDKARELWSSLRNLRPSERENLVSRLPWPVVIHPTVRNGTEVLAAFEIDRRFRDPHASSGWRRLKQPDPEQSLEAAIQLADTLTILNRMRMWMPAVGKAELAVFDGGPAGVAIRIGSSGAILDTERTDISSWNESCVSLVAEQLPGQHRLNFLKRMKRIKEPFRSMLNGQPMLSEVLRQLRSESARVRARTAAIESGFARNVIAEAVGDPHRDTDTVVLDALDHIELESACEAEPIIRRRIVAARLAASPLKFRSDMSPGVLHPDGDLDLAPELARFINREDRLLVETVRAGVVRGDEALRLAKRSARVLLAEIADPEPKVVRGSWIPEERAWPYGVEVDWPADTMVDRCRLSWMFERDRGSVVVHRYGTGARKAFVDIPPAVSERLVCRWGIAVNGDVAFADRSSTTVVNAPTPPVGLRERVERYRVGPEGALDRGRHERHRQAVRDARRRLAVKAMVAVGIAAALVAAGVSVYWLLADRGAPGVSSSAPAAPFERDEFTNQIEQKEYS
jgi:hypothetical protein